MSLHEILFVIFSAVILIFSFMTIISRRILRSATYLLFVLLATACIYLWLQYEFMAAVQVSLYAGGIVVLIVFAVLLTHHIHHQSKTFPVKRMIAGFGIATVGATVTIAAILSHDFHYHEAEPLTVDMNVIGSQMVSTGQGGYALPFEVISILLLAVLIGAIIVAKKDKPQDKTTEN